MNDQFDNKDWLRASQPPARLSRQHKEMGSIKGRTPVVVATKPLTVAYIKHPTPKKIREIKEKYSYLTKDPNDQTKNIIKGKALENVKNAKPATSLSDENSLT